MFNLPPMKGWGLRRYGWVSALVAVVALMLTALPASAVTDDVREFTRTRFAMPQGAQTPQPGVQKRGHVSPESPAEAKRRTDYVKTLPQRTRAADAVNMSECWDAMAPSTGGEDTLSHFTWCKVGLFTAEDVRCDPSCKTVGSVSFRMSMMGMGNQGASATEDRKIRVWVMLDEAAISAPPPDLTKRLRFAPACSTTNSKTTCTPGPETGDTFTLGEWSRFGGLSTNIDFTLPPGTATDTERLAYGDFALTSKVLGNPINTDSQIRGPESGFRCDSSPSVNYHGCVFPDVISQFWLKATPDVIEEANHVWKAQNQSDLTLPISPVGKSIPGSRKTGQPLERLTHAASKKANNDKSARYCREYWGRGYSQGNTKQCDEYPFQSTWQGSSVGGSSTKHFSVEVIDREQNRVGGEHLNAFYNSQRIIEQDKFYVDVLAADGSPYQGAGVPSGVAAPVQYSSCENSTLVEAKQVETAAYPQDVFNKYASTTARGWTGGDSTYSVTLPDGRRLWLFSDTWLGPLKADGTRPTDAPFINSSIVSQVGDNLETITGGTTSSPTALMSPPEDSHWYWLGDALVADVAGKKKLQVVFHEWYKFGADAWDFGFYRALVATFDPGDLSSPESIAPLPSKADVQWGAAVMSPEQSDDGYTYIYGVNDAPVNKKMRVARVKGSNIADAGKWQYLNAEKGAWMYGETEGNDITAGIANEYSVTPHNGNFILVSQDSTEAFSGKIRMWQGCDPYGPFGSWVGHDEVYRMPEPGPYGTCEDGKCFSYNAHVHPSLASGDRWTLSYNVNNFDTTVSPEGAHFRDPTIYRPRFVSFKLISTGTLRSKAKLSYSASSPSRAPAFACRPNLPPIAGTFSMKAGPPCA
ncbi:NucA/NucB deoxyribonuclease domain-containing protein [Streptomyces cyaneofuscatus]